MYCTECGAQVPDDSDYCNSCGADLTALKRANAEIQVNESKSSENIEDIAAAAAAAAKAAAANDSAGFSDLDDSESGTTVLTEDMSGPLKISDALTSPVPPVQPGPGPQPQPQVQKVVTPAPVTNSTILNSDIPPVGPQMNSFQHQLPPQPGFQPAGIPDGYKPISPWGYLGYALLFAIPIVGLVLMFVWGFGENTNKNLKNYARYYLICVVIGIVVAIILTVIAIVTGAAILGTILDMLH